MAEFAATIPPGYKIFGLNEKYVLKKAMRPELPPEILKRVKQPYMAPDSNSFVQDDSPAYVNELMSVEALRRTGIFNPQAVALLYKKCKRGASEHLSFKDNMAFVGILSTQLLVKHFLDDFRPAEPVERAAFTVWHEDV